MRIAERIMAWAEPRAIHHLDQLPPVRTQEEVQELPVSEQVSAASHWWMATLYLLPILVCMAFGAKPSET